ncbi:MAG TPA: hypothetical protein VFB22_05730 [Candidatus Baltobacteraceae bacterium]|nr:hypothetical protein [Candidatus Baltobacteraceae bacterium]
MDESGKADVDNFLAAYAEELSRDERRLLKDAATRVVDEAFSAIETYTDWRADAPEQDRVALFRETSLSAYLPERFANRYGPLFMKKYAVAVVSVGLKMAHGEPMSLSSTAEELAFYAIVEAAKGDIELSDAGDVDEKHLDDFADSVYEDTDFLMLFSGQFDGIEDSDLGRSIGVANLDFDEWFLPFRDDALHPYVNDT